jgi:hypothetical protein
MLTVNVEQRVNMKLFVKRIHAQIALPAGKEPRTPVEWPSEPVWAF